MAVLERWSPERCERFTTDWNNGMPSEVLREKYGLSQYRFWARVTNLRKRGYSLKQRKQGFKAEL